MHYTTKTVYLADDGREFSSEKEAKEYCSKHIIYQVNSNETYTIAHNDIEFYEKLLQTQGVKEFFVEYHKLCNSNSMGALYPIIVMQYVIEKYNLECPV